MSKNNSGCLTSIVNIFRKAEKREYSRPQPYGKQQYFLSKAEISFYHVLNQIVQDKLVICPKVRLADLLYVKVKGKYRTTYFNKISAKHIDFVLCQPDTMDPVLAIELDDASHNTDDRRKRDYFLDIIFEDAGFPLMRVPAKRGYTVNDIRPQLMSYFSQSSPEQMSQE